MIDEIREDAITLDQSPAALVPDAEAPPDLDNRICAAPGCYNILVRHRGRRIEPLCRWIARRYCCQPCSAADQAARMTARSATDDMAPDWPEITGPALDGTPFAAHDVRANDNGPFRLSPPATHVATGSALG